MHSGEQLELRCGRQLYLSCMPCNLHLSHKLRMCAVLNKQRLCQRTCWGNRCFPTCQNLVQVELGSAEDVSLEERNKLLYEVGGEQENGKELDDKSLWRVTCQTSTLKITEHH